MLSPFLGIAGAVLGVFGAFLVGLGFYLLFTGEPEPSTSAISGLCAGAGVLVCIIAYFVYAAKRRFIRP